MNPRSESMPMHYCGWCGDFSWGVHCKKLVNGELRYSLYCKSCDSENVIETVSEWYRSEGKQPSGTVWVVKKAYAEWLGGATRNSQEMGTVKCAVRTCSSMETEEHHFAPKEMFLKEADEWPTAYLCKEHHHLWHKIVTPELFKKMQKYQRGSND